MCCDARRNPLSSSAAILKNWNLCGVSRNTRCSVLTAMVRKAEIQPTLNKKHKMKHHDWAKKHLKTDFVKVLWTDEMRVTLDEPHGWAHGLISNGHRAPIRRHQGGGGGTDMGRY